MVGTDRAMLRPIYHQILPSIEHGKVPAIEHQQMPLSKHRGKLAAIEH